jgi:hypothetical protein
MTFLHQLVERQLDSVVDDEVICCLLLINLFIIYLSIYYICSCHLLVQKTKQKMMEIVMKKRVHGEI